jgi:hypothetical protein
MRTTTQHIDAIIGVYVQDDRTFYVKRSPSMENYPNAWSLLSIQFTLDELQDFLDLPSAQRVMERMSQERLCGAPVHVVRYLKSARCSDNPMGVPVRLHLYEIELEEEPRLNPEYYIDSAWMTPEEYTVASANSTCGLCMRMWSDYCVENGLCETRFAPEVVEDEEED